MKTTTTRRAIRGKRSATGKRLVLTPPTKRTALLNGTALASGILAGLAAFIATPNPAFAQQNLGTTCSEGVANFFTCAGVEAGNIYFEPDAAFQADFGPNTANPYTQTINSAAPAVTIDAGGNSTAGNGVHFFPNSSINNAGGTGLYMFDVGDVVVNVDGGGGGNDAVSIVGSTIGILIDGADSEGEGGGSSAIVNVDGHVAGGSGAGIEITNVDFAMINNHSYLSVMGGNGAYIHDVGAARLNNNGGLTAGLTLSGALIEDIFNDGTESGPAVLVNNNSWRAPDDTLFGGGVLVGNTSGLQIAFVGGNTTEGDDAADIVVNNNGWFEANESGGFDARAGGLIAGVNVDGVDVFIAEGDVLINNNLTRMGSIDLAGLDPQVYDEANESGLLWDVLPGFAGPQGFTTGIYGNQNGVDLTFVEGSSSLWNVNGQIVGAEGDGVRFFDIGSVFIDNSGTGDDLFFPLITEGGMEHIGPDVIGGRIWGGESGVEGFLAGPVFLNNNDRGFTFGVQNGVMLGASSGLFAMNLGGTIEGYYGDGVNVSESKLGFILNGGWQDADGNWHEGRILGGDSAIASAAAKVGVLNLPGGLIIGDGDDLDGQAVMKFWTDNEGGFIGSSGAFVLNAGIAGSHNNPHIMRTWDFPEVNEIPAYNIDTAQIVEDVRSIEQFAMSGGAIANGIGANGELSIDDYRETASDGLVDSEGGALALLNITGLGGMGDGLLLLGPDVGEGDVSPWDEGNQGIMFGRIVATGTTFDCIDVLCEGEGDEIIGNSVINLGSWFTTNLPQLPGFDGGNILVSEGEDEIINLGFVQTAFGEGDAEGNDGDYTSFLLDDFYNGNVNALLDDGVSEGEGGFLGIDGGAGWLSMTDGDAADHTYIFGNFHGAVDPNFRSYLALDANLMTAGFSDVLWTGINQNEDDDLFGSTGVVVNDLSPGSTIVDVGTQIKFADIGGLVENKCFDAWCQDGDAFFVSELNPNYVNVSDIGFIRDGLYMWGVKEVGDPEYYFEATWGPDAVQLPTLTTAAQTAWYETGGVVEDHIYGNVFPLAGAGGSGADLSYPVPEVPVPVAKTHSGALWGRMTGSWANRDTEVIVDEGEPTELTFDTGYNQDTYSLLGGVEFQPGYGTMGDSAFRLGLFGGYVGSHVRYDDYGASATLKGPTVGGYGALVSGGFYVDAEVKGDFLAVEYTTPSTEITTKATSVGVLANAGYRMESGNGFLEPIVSFAYVSTHLDDSVGPGGEMITYSNGSSVRGGIGARVGTVMVNANGTSTELDLLGKIWNEFGEANTVTIDNGVDPPETFTDGITGVFGEVTGRATVYSADRRTSGFVSAGAKFGTDWTTLQAKAGVRQNF